jgi:hypothetical protein
MSKRVALVIVVAAVVILCAIMIPIYTGKQRPTDRPVAEAVIDKPGTDGTISEIDIAAGGTHEATREDEASATPGQSGSISAIERAAEAGKYTFVFFYSDESEKTESARSSFRKTVSRVTEQAVPLEVDTSNPAERPIVDRFNVSRAPMPLVLAVAPNGAITGGFPQQFDEKNLLEAFVSPGTERSLKALQDSRVVLVCVQNASTTSNDVAMKGVQDVKADPGFGPSTEIVAVDPANPAESEFLAALKIDPQTNEAITVCLVPPGKAVARFEGATDKKTIIAALTSSTSCGPSGCGPQGCGP